MRLVADNPTVLLLSHSAEPQSGSQFPSRDHSSERFPCFQCRPKLTLALSYCSELNFRLSLLHSTCCFPLPPIKGSKNPQCFSPMWMNLTSNPKLPNPQPLREVTGGATVRACPRRTSQILHQLTCSPSKPMILGIDGPQISMSRRATWE